jgi:hypothetical protein
MTMFAAPFRHLLAAFILAAAAICAVGPAAAFGPGVPLAAAVTPALEATKVQFFWPFRPQRSYTPPPAQRRDVRRAPQGDSQAPAPQARKTNVPRGSDGALVGNASEAENATRIVVFGDSVAKDLWEGLLGSIGEEENFEVFRRTKVSSGIVRDDFYDWNAAVAETLEAGRVDIAIWLIGINDLQQLRDAGGRYEPHTPEWTEAYKKRIDGHIGALQAKGAAVYWVGLPIVRSDRLTRGYAKINDILRERTELLGARFIDIWDGFADENGAYSAYGPDVSGTRRKLRRGNGIHFTDVGNAKLVHFVEQEFRKDLAVAGTTLDGRRVIQQGQRGGLVISGTGANADGELAGAIDPATGLADPAMANVAALPAPNAAPGQPMMLNAPQTADDKTDGEEVFSPLFTVLMRGDALPPKSGRADDFTWDGDDARR